MSQPTAYQRFAWGLSVGIRVLAVAGWIWFGWAVSAAESVTTAAILFWAATAGAAGLFWGGIHVRRLAGDFRYRDLKRSSPEDRPANRRINRVFGTAIAAEWILIGCSGFFTYHFGRGDLFPPAVSLAVSLHFFPLAAVLRLRAYSVTAASGSLIALIGLLTPAASLAADARQMLVCTIFASVMWATAAYFIGNARRLSEAYKVGVP